MRWFFWTDEMSPELSRLECWHLFGSAELKGLTSFLIFPRKYSLALIFHANPKSLSDNLHEITAYFLQFAWNIKANFLVKIRKTRASRWCAIAYPHASTIAYLHAHQNSKRVLPVLILRAITCDSFKIISQKASEELCDNPKKKDPKSYFLTSSDPQTSPEQNFWTTVFYSSLPLIWYAKWLYVCTKWILDPWGPHPLALSPGLTLKFWMCSSSPHPHPPGPAPRGYIKILNMFLQSLSIELLPVKVLRF